MSIIIEQGITIQGGITIGSGSGGGGGSGLVTANLQLYLDAALSSSYPGSGTVWYDLSGNGNDVTAQNSGSISYTSSGGGYFSTGADGYFNNASTTNLPSGSAYYTLCAWVQWPSGEWPGDGGILCIGDGFGSVNSVNAFRTINAPNGTNNYWWGNDLSAGITLDDYTAWVNVVAQWDGTTRNLWANGTQVGSDNTTGLNTNNANLQVGLTWPAQSEFLQGNIGQALIYDRALTSAEILQNFTAVRSRYGV
jgi:hypothetical protein